MHFILLNALVLTNLVDCHKNTANLDEVKTLVYNWVLPISLLARLVDESSPDINACLIQTEASFSV